MNLFPEEIPVIKGVENKVRCVASCLAVKDEQKSILLDNFKKYCSDKAVAKYIQPIVMDQHPDLLYVSAILVSTLINDNDDVFLPEEVWPVRHTPIFTPYNEEHSQTDIIGHIYNARCLNSNKECLDDMEAYNGYFDIEVDAVIYKSVYPEKAEMIQTGAMDGERYVSMEATFANFDYLVVQNDDVSTAKLVKRTENTAFLTKYLRVYGGPGTFNSDKLYRVLRNLRFSGMGDVKTPGNPGSVYTRVSSSPVEELAYTEAKVRDNKIKGEKMEELELAKAKIVELETQLKDLTDKYSVLSTLASDHETLKQSFESEKAKVESLKAELTQKTDTLNKQIEAFSALKAELDTANAELEKIDAEKKLNEKLAILASINVKLSEDRKKTIASLPQNAFDEFVSWAKEIAEDVKEVKLDIKPEQTEAGVIPPETPKDEQVEASAVALKLANALIQPKKVKSLRK